MALKKQVDFKGKPAEYWAILWKKWHKFNDITQGEVGLYFSRNTRNDDEKKNVLRSLDFSFPGELTRAEIYVELKKSRPLTKLVTQAVTDDEGNIVTPAVFETTETNELFGSEDV